MNTSTLTSDVESARTDIWEERPNEVRQAIIGSQGTFGQSFFPALYATQATREIQIFFSIIRDINKDQSSDLTTLKSLFREILISKATRSFKYAKMEHTSELFLEISGRLDEIHDEDQFNELLQEVILYVGRMNYWLDEAMPWYELLSVYEVIMKDAVKP